MDEEKGQFLSYDVQKEAYRDTKSLITTFGKKIMKTFNPQNKTKKMTKTLARSGRTLFALVTGIVNSKTLSKILRLSTLKLALPLLSATHDISLVTDLYMSQVNLSVEHPKSLYLAFNASCIAMQCCRIMVGKKFLLKESKEHLSVVASMLNGIVIEALSITVLLIYECLRSNPKEKKETIDSFKELLKFKNTTSDDYLREISNLVDCVVSVALGEPEEAGFQVLRAAAVKEFQDKTLDCLFHQTIRNLSSIENVMYNWKLIYDFFSGRETLVIQKVELEASANLVIDMLCDVDPKQLTETNYGKERVLPSFSVMIQRAFGLSTYLRPLEAKKLVELRISATWGSEKIKTKATLDSKLINAGYEILRCGTNVMSLHYRRFDNNQFFGVISYCLKKDITESSAINELGLAFKDFDTEIQTTIGKDVQMFVTVVYYYWDDDKLSIESLDYESAKVWFETLSPGDVYTSCLSPFEFTTSKSFFKRKIHESGYYFVDSANHPFISSFPMDPTLFRQFPGSSNRLSSVNRPLTLPYKPNGSDNEKTEKQGQEEDEEEEGDDDVEEEQEEEDVKNDRVGVGNKALGNEDPVI